MSPLLTYGNLNFAGDVPANGTNYIPLYVALPGLTVLYTLRVVIVGSNVLSAASISNFSPPAGYRAANPGHLISDYSLYSSAFTPFSTLRVVFRLVDGGTVTIRFDYDNVAGVYGFYSAIYA